MHPFAYEFYHQLWRLLDEGDVEFDGPIIQAEVIHFFKINLPLTTFLMFSIYWKYSRRV